MQLHIRHETRYRYERPVKYSVQSLHLTPRRDPGQRALSWTITAPGRRLEQIDAYGNISHLLTIEEPHREIRIVVHGMVETADTEAPPGRRAAVAARLSCADRADRAQRGDHVPSRAGAMERSTDPRARAEALAEAVCGAVRYKPGTSDVQDSAAVASRAAKGCARTTRTSTSPRRARSACRRAT